MLSKQAPQSVKAIDAFGILGSFYDGRRDQIVKRHLLGSTMYSSEISSSPYCTIEKGSTNLLRVIGMQNQLRVNLLLDITKRVGIAAVLNYSRRINEHTRFLYYSRITRREKAQLAPIPADLPMDATHLICAIDFGVDLVAVLQLPAEPDVVQQIDAILGKVRHALSNDQNTALRLTTEEERILERLVNVTTYSNTSSLMAATSLSDILYQLTRMKNTANHCHPLVYYLQYRSPNDTFSMLPVELSEQIERYILHLRTPIKYLEASLNQHMPQYLYGNLQDRIYHARQQCSILKEIYIQTTRRLTNLLVSTDSGVVDISRVRQELNTDNEQSNALRNSIEQLMRAISDLENAVHIGTGTQKLPFEFLEESEDDDTLFGTDTTSEEEVPDDDLSTRHSTFSIPTSSQSPETPMPPVDDQEPVETKPILPPSNEVYNVVLLGETGVGKSTFINALFNYLTFGRFEQAESNETIALIPLHDNADATQHCRTYVFHLDDGSKLRLIDTPGFGDARDTEQDERNMEHILKYLDHLTHINAICFLFKPNVSRLNAFFHSCLTQLGDFLGTSVLENLIFCFTHTRPTGYTPGDTTALSASLPLKFENTFSFENESFRYLLARNEDDKSDYQTSWSTSAKECHRWIDYIRWQLTAHSLQEERRSIKHAQFEIFHLVRPLLEALRNTLRNITLWNIESPNQSIELRPVVIHRPVALCLSCNPKIIKAGNFGVLADVPHDIREVCRTCRCAPSKHVQAEYLLEYKLLHRPSPNQISELKDQLAILRDACVEFAYFLVHVAGCTKQNLLLVQITRMIEQETYICRRSESNYLNVQLVKELTRWKQNYEERTGSIISNDAHGDLTPVYHWLGKMNEIPVINEQLTAIRKGEEIMLQQYESQAMQI